MQFLLMLNLKWKVLLPHYFQLHTLFVCRKSHTKRNSDVLASVGVPPTQHDNCSIKFTRSLLVIRKCWCLATAGAYASCLWAAEICILDVCMLSWLDFISLYLQPLTRTWRPYIYTLTCAKWVTDQLPLEAPQEEGIRHPHAHTSEATMPLVL